MKTLIKKSKQLASVLCMLLFTSFTQAQSHVTMSLKNIHFTENTLSFDLFIVNDGTTKLKLAGCSYGVDFNAAIVNNGQISYKFIPESKDPLLHNFKPYSISCKRNETTNQARLTSGSIPYDNAVELEKNASLKIGRFVLQNNKPWTSNSNPAFTLNNRMKIGFTNTQIIAFVENDKKLNILTSENGKVNCVVDDSPILNSEQLPSNAILHNKRLTNVKDSIRDVTIYPNPVIDILNIEWTSSDETQQLQVSIIDLVGKVVHNEVIENDQPSQKLKVNVSALIPGTYILKINDKIQTNYSRKFIKK